VVAGSTAIHFAMLPENREAFMAYVMEANQDQDDPIPAKVFYAMMSAAHRRLTPSCPDKL
jgi:hypothetical protein